MWKGERMYYFDTMDSPIGALVLTSDGDNLTGVWFQGQKLERVSVKDQKGVFDPDVPALRQGRDWLERYFANPGTDPGALPPCDPAGSEFRKAVCQIMSEIPYGQLTTYGDIAKELVRRGVLKRPSAQPVGGAVGHNTVGIVIPCHRVIGAKGNLTGYGGGMKRKVFLLTHEGVDMSVLTVPTKGTAL